MKTLIRNAALRAFFVLLAISSAMSLEVREGRIKLILHENSGRFSLYYMSDIAKEKYDALFVDQDPRTSFVALLVDDKAFRLGESTSFRYSAKNDSGKPSLVFESSSLLVTQEFTFFRTTGAGLADGVEISVRVENKGERQASVGVRMLIDTKLGESTAKPFSTDSRDIAAETTLLATDADKWWYSRNDQLGLMGSIDVGGIQRPDSIHIANWKRLNDAPWKASPSAGRNFNFLPYSVGDSALCYYFDPKAIARGESRTVAIRLAVASETGFSAVGSVAENDISRIFQESVNTAASPELAIRTDLLTIRDLLDRIDAALKAGGALSDDELTAMETAVQRIIERNGIK